MLFVLSHVLVITFLIKLPPLHMWSAPVEKMSDVNAEDSSEEATNMNDEEEYSDEVMLAVMGGACHYM